jgi:LDH2 family malate/lactate/ureidoglycolate dehydrogenase
MTENVKVNIYELKNLMQEVARSCGLNREEAKIVVEDYWEAELMGKLSHGVSKFCWEVKYFNERRGPAKIIIDKGAVILIDSNKEMGQVATKFSVEMVIERAKKIWNCFSRNEKLSTLRYFS